MSGFKKLLRRKDNKAKNAASSEDLSQSTLEMAAGAAGYFIAKEKDLPKLHKAVWSKDMTKLKQLIKKADINQLDKENRTALHLAAATGNDEMCRFLLANKAKTNLCDNHGRTPLLKSVETQSHNCTELLLENGADANVIDVMNSSSLHLASANGEIEIAVLLIGKGAKVNAQDKEGFTPLHVSSSLGYQDFVGFLIHEGASINAVDAHGRTSLMTAASEGHIGIVKLLLQNNANTEIRDSQGWKASDHAIIQGHHSCSNIIEEHEEKIEAQQRPAPAPAAAKTTRKAANNNNNISGLVGTNELEFSFGGPALDIGAESASEREQDSASHDSIDENSWNSSGGEGIYEEVSNKDAKPSLLAALNKQVTRSESNVSAHSHRSTSRIPVRKESFTSTTSQVSKQTTPDKPMSRIPVPNTGSPKLPKKQSSSAQSTPTNSAPGTPTKGGYTPTFGGQTPIKGGQTPTLGTPKMDRANERLHVGGDVSPARLSGDGQQSLPWESIGVVSDDESQITESDASEKVAALLSGKGLVPSKETKKPKDSIFMTEPDDKESDLNVTFSDDENSIELPIDDDYDDVIVKKSESKVPTSTLEVPAISNEKKKDTDERKETNKKDPVPKLDLNSSVSSVSDPDLSVASEKKEKKKPKKSGESSMSEDSEWDTSDDDILPSDDPGATGGSSLFGGGKRITPLPTNTNKKKAEEKTAKKLPPSYEASDSEATETESEWEKEASNKKKLSKQLKEDERDKEDERMKKWEEEKAAKEKAMALQIQKELEMEMEMERLERESEEKRDEEEREERRRIEEQEEKERRDREDRERRDEELKLLEEEKDRIRKSEEEKLLRERAERARVEEALRTLEREKEEERIRIEREKEEELERQMGLKEQEMLRLKKERDEERHRRQEEEQRLRIQNENELQKLQLEKEKELERQMKEKEHQMLLQKKTYEERLERERRLLEDREADEARRRKEETIRNEEIEKQRQQELSVRQRRIKEEEDNLLEAYRKKQEELLEQERMFEEEMARRERELEEKMRLKELERQPVMEEPLFAVQEQQVHATEINDISAFMKSQDDTITKETAAFENSARTREENELKDKIAIRALREDEEQLKQRHENLKRKSLQDLTSQDEDEELEKLGESMRWKKAQREMLEGQQKAHQDITDQHALEVKIEMEKRQLQDLETRKDILDRQVGVKLTELSNRKRRDELEEKSRQLMQEREQLNASFEAAKRRSAVLELETTPTSNEEGDDNKRRSFGGQEKPPTSSQPLSSGYVDDVDWSESSEEDNQASSPVRAEMLGSSLPRFQSTTKVDGHAQSPVVQAISPLAKTTPLSGSFSAQDAQSTSRLQEALRDAKRQIDKLKERNLALENSRKHLEKDLAEVQGKLQGALKNKADVEHSRLQSESDIRSLRYKYEQESESRRVAESLLTQLKDQIKRSDEKLAKEMESRQKLETEMRHLVKGKKDNLQTLNHQETDLNDLQQALSDEQEARVRMTDMYNDIKKQMTVLMEEARTSTHEKAVVMAELEAVDQTRKTHEAHSGSLRDQLMSAQTGLAETRARLEATVLTTNKEIEMLREKLLKKTDKLAKADEVIAELRATSENQQATNTKEHANLSNRLESEGLERKRMESEIASLKIRLENANNELDKATLARTQAENTCHGLKDELYQVKLKLEKELSSLREANQAMTTRLEHAENKASSLDQELQLSTLTMTEKGGHLNLAQREVEHIKASQQRTEEKLAIEKGQNAKLSSKLENTENKLLSLMSDSDSLKRQLELANEKVRKLEEAAVRSEAKYHSTIESLRADLDKNKELMAGNKNNLAESMKLLKEDSNKISENSIRREEEVKQLNQELNTTTRKLAQTETALDMQTKAREELESDRSRLREQLRVFEAKLMITGDSRDEIVGRANRLEEQLGQSMRASDDAASRLASRSADLESVTRSLSQLENLVNRLKSDKAQLASALKDEQVKGELLLKEIRDAIEARQSLESILTNVKAENIQLEEKIQSEELNRTISGKEAQEHKELWESELRARTKLGTKIVNAEKKLSEAQTSLDEERRKTRKVLEMKKAVEAKLEAQDERSSHHHKDILALKSQLKSYKRRLKEYETSEGRIPSIRSEFDKERAANESHIASLRRQIDSISDKLRQEMETRTRLELANKQQQQELSAAKSNEKEMAFDRERLERTNRQLEEELQRTTAYYEENYVEKGQLDVFKKEAEAKSRFEINRKLEEVNQHLADESSAREKLDRMREQNVAKTRTEMEKMIADLKNELSRSRSNVHEHETQKDTISAEAKRYKELYENELNAKNKLTSRLSKANEKVAESKAMLNLERSRRIHTATDRDSGFVTSPKYSPDPLSSFMSRSSRSPTRYGQDEDQLMKAVESELNRSIKRHLETGPVTTDLDLMPSPLNTSDHETNSYPGLSHASKEYMSLLQKKYYV